MNSKTRIRRFVAECLFQAGWNPDKIADAAGFRRTTLEGWIFSDRDASDIPGPRTWKMLAELALDEKLDEKHKALKTALEKLLGWNIAVAEFTAAQRALRLLMVPDISALPEWQQRLVRSLWPEIFDPPPNELTTRDLLQAIDSGTIDFLENGDPDIERWLVRKTEIRCLVRPFLDSSWEQTINESVWQLPRRKAKFVRYFYMHRGADAAEDESVLILTAAQRFRMRQETAHKHLATTQSALREELKSVELLIALMPLNAQTAELERIIRVREEEERRTRSL